MIQSFALKIHARWGSDDEGLLSALEGDVGLTGRKVVS